MLEALKTAVNRAHSRCRACRLIESNKAWAIKYGATYYPSCGHTCRKDLVIIQTLALAVLTEIQAQEMGERDSQLCNETCDCFYGRMRAQIAKETSGGNPQGDQPAGD